MDQEEITDSQLPSPRTRHLPDPGVRHQCWRHLCPGHLLQPGQNLREGAEPEVWSLPHQWWEARLSSEEWQRIHCEAETAPVSWSQSQLQPGIDTSFKCWSLVLKYDAQVKVQRTLNWVLSQDSDSGTGSSGHTTPEPGLLHHPASRLSQQEPVNKSSSNITTDQENNVSLDTSLPPPVSKPSFTMPTTSIHNALDSVWTDKGNQSCLYLSSWWYIFLSRWHQGCCLDWAEWLWSGSGWSCEHRDQGQQEQWHAGHAGEAGGWRGQVVGSLGHLTILVITSHCMLHVMTALYTRVTLLWFYFMLSIL